MELVKLFAWYLIILLSGVILYASNEKVITLTEYELRAINDPSFCGNDVCRELIENHNLGHKI